jgi:taurine dioxygenase
MGYQSIEVKPIAGALGAEIQGVDLAGELSNQAFDEIYQAFLDHHTIYFRDQDLTPQQQVAFGRRFGKPNIYPFVEGLKEAPEIFEILKTESDEKNFGGAWHSDTTYLEVPPIATMLYAKEAPEVGGDTLFANTVLAYEALSDGLKETLEGMQAVYSAALSNQGGRKNLLKANVAMKNQDLEQAETMEAVHPVIRTIPQTGRKSLYINSVHTTNFVGWTQEESKPLIEYLASHCVRPEFTCRLNWQTETLAIWDNRCAQHFAINDYHGQRRRMHRMTIEGETAV